jgi:hypothetical protein
VGLEVESQDDLRDEQDLEDPGKRGVDVVEGVLAVGMRVAEEEAGDGEGGAEDLGWNVPAGLSNLDNNKNSS